MARAWARRQLSSALCEGWLKPDALVVLEETRSADVDVPDGFICVQDRVYGDTRIHILRRG